MDCKCFTVVFSCLVVTSVRSQLLQTEPYDYCDPRLKLCEVFTDHTMCKYPIPGPSPQCTEGIHEPLSTPEKDRILYWHNKFRSYVANGTEKNKTRKLPASSNMRQLYWDGELEAIAARWADQCTSMTHPTAYDKCRNTKRFRVSQNVGTRRVNGTSIEKQAPQIVITWYKENKDFDPVLVDKFVPMEGDKVSVKQFANMIWADTYALGCARVIFQEKLPLSDRDARSTTWSTERLVCNYGPGGTEAGKPIYRRGAPCERCPGGTECSRAFPGLCAIQGGNKTEAKAPPREKGSPDSGVRRPETETENPPGKKDDSDSRGREEDEGKGEGKGADEGADEGRDDSCREGKCYKDTDSRNRFNDLINLPQPTARKKSREVGLVVPGQGNDINIEKRKWIVSNGGKVKREKPQNQPLQNGDSCKCFIRVDDDFSGSSRSNRNVFLLLFSTFITVETFLFSTYHCN